MLLASSAHCLAATIQHHQRYSARFVQRPSALLVQWHIALLAQQPSALLDERLSALAGWLAGSLAGWLAEYRLGWLCRNSFQGIPSAWGGVGILIKCLRHAARRRDDAEFGLSSLFIHIDHQAQASPPFRLHPIDLQAHRPTDGAQAPDMSSSTSCTPSEEETAYQCRRLDGGSRHGGGARNAASCTCGCDQGEEAGGRNTQSVGGRARKHYPRDGGHIQYAQGDKQPSIARLRPAVSAAWAQSGVRVSILYIVSVIGVKKTLLSRFWKIHLHTCLLLLHAYLGDLSPAIFRSACPAAFRFACPAATRFPCPAAFRFARPPAFRSAYPAVNRSISPWLSPLFIHIDRGSRPYLPSEQEPSAPQPRAPVSERIRLGELASMLHCLTHPRTHALIGSTLHCLLATIQHHQRYSALLVQRPSVLFAERHSVLLAQRHFALRVLTICFGSFSGPSSSDPALAK